VSGGSEREEHEGGRCGPCAECRASSRPAVKTRAPAVALGDRLFKVCEYLRDHPHAVRGSIWVHAAEALEQLAQPPDQARLEARIAELEAAAREKPTEPDPSLEAIASNALDDLHDRWGADDKGPPTQQALEGALHAAGLFNAEKGTITPAGEALALRVARRGAAPDPAAIGPCRGCGAPIGEPCRPSCPDRLVPAARPDPAPAPSPAGVVPGVPTPAAAPDAVWLRWDRARGCAEPVDAPPDAAPRPMRVYVAGGSAEVELVARYVAALRAAGVEVTYDWTPDFLEGRQRPGAPQPAEQRAAHARADLDGIARADLVWWILPAARSEGSAFEAGVAHALGKRLVVSGARAAHGRVFPELAAERWDSHDAALAAIVSLAAECRKGGAP